LRITILSVGHKMPAWIQDGFQEYTRRMPPELRIELVELKPEDRASGKDSAKAMAAEGARILAALPQGEPVIALDERGKALSTQGLSVVVAALKSKGMSPAFIIGGADGLDAAVKERSDKLVSLSALTLPHALVRVVLAEQLYRAWSILARHPYHRE